MNILAYLRNCQVESARAVLYQSRQDGKSFDRETFSSIGFGVGVCHQREVDRYGRRFENTRAGSKCGDVQERLEVCVTDDGEGEQFMSLGCELQKQGVQYRRRR